MGFGSHGVATILLHRQRDRALVRAFLWGLGDFLARRSGPSLDGEDQVPCRIGKDYPVKLAQESLKYVTCLSKPRGNGGFPEKASEIG